MVKQYEELGFTDDFMFCKVLTSNPDLCKELLALILKKDVTKIGIPESQRPIEITADGKGVRLDVYIEDEDTVYDIEMQTTVNANLPKRSRYYQGMLDLSILKPGANYLELKSSYIIFICLKDPFGKNAPIYTMRNRCEEYEDVYLDDGATKIFLNAAGVSDSISDELRDFLTYVATGNPNGKLAKAIDFEVAKAKSKQGWRQEYMLLEERYKEKYDEGVAEGIAKGIAKGVAKGVAETNQHHIKQLFQNGFSVEDVAKLFVDVPADTIQAVWESFIQSQEDNA